MDKNNGGPAFPIGSGDMRDPVGISVRDYFAAKAMQAIVQSPDAYEIDTIPGGEAIAANAYDIADAMLRAREQ